MDNVNILLLHFLVSNRLFAIELSVIERVVRAVSITPLLHGESIIAGVINYEGERIIAIDLSKKFGLPSSDYGLDSRLIIVNTSKGKLALIANQIVDSNESVPFKLYEFSRAKLQQNTTGVERYTVYGSDESLVFICDADTLINTVDEAQLAELLYNTPSECN